MNTKVFIQPLVYASVFALLALPQALGEQDCHEDKVKFLEKCSWHIVPGFPYARPSPSNSCCKAVRKFDMTCICRIITHQDNADGHYVYRVSVDCNNPVPPGNKCGDWSIPGPPPPHNLQL
ncbi:hypothetical protein EJB05_12757 [Eragrostis curvula]|uniref:Bifunctional inhibitor/plant lipid transfer protein/seed storage helical domain-containing protein n=1 Tax=Eragrostis curvula TaxID=38414 RepID=A0A5J9SYC0_9POAL|nr:hypothetical protein EJB05_50473 [Eragrostis curvula]TVU39344.1 hypothetical protein EJB05_12757 [Eragrostis curvula]